MSQATSSVLNANEYMEEAQSEQPCSPWNVRYPEEHRKEATRSETTPALIATRWRTGQCNIGHITWALTPKWKQVEAGKSERCCGRRWWDEHRSWVHAPTCGNISRSSKESCENDPGLQIKSSTWNLRCLSKKKDERWLDHWERVEKLSVRHTKA